MALTFAKPLKFNSAAAADFYCENGPPIDTRRRGKRQKNTHAKPHKADGGKCKFFISQFVCLASESWTRSTDRNFCTTNIQWSRCFSALSSRVLCRFVGENREIFMPRSRREIRKMRDRWVFGNSAKYLRPDECIDYKILRSFRK